MPSKLRTLASVMAKKRTRSSSGEAQKSSQGYFVIFFVPAGIRLFN